MVEKSSKPTNGSSEKPIDVSSLSTQSPPSKTLAVVDSAMVEESSKPTKGSSEKPIDISSSTHSPPSKDKSSPPHSEDESLKPIYESPTDESPSPLNTDEMSWSNYIPSADECYWATFSSSDSSENRPSPIKIGAALKDLGNSWLNAVLQCLTHTVPLVQSLRSCCHVIPSLCDEGDFCLLSALRAHVERSLALSGMPISPRILVNNLSHINPSFRRSKQEDALELLRCMLGKLQLCTEISFAEQIFGGHLRSRLQCSHCGHCSDSFEPRFDLSLAIEGVDSLSTALKSFTRVEKMGDCKPCENCKEKASSEKRVTIDRAPEVAVLHLKRFKTNDDLVVVKINDHVEYPSELDLQPFLNNPSGEDNESSKYDLYAVLVHDGISVSSGHYFCFIRSSPDSWYRLDDSKVGDASKYDALNQKAYILFYKRQVCPWFSSFMEAERSSPGPSSSMEAGRSSPGPSSLMEEERSRLGPLNMNVSLTYSGSNFDNLGAALENLGNTCFLNAVLQCLTHTVLFVKSLCHWDHAIPNRCVYKDFCLFFALREHVNCSLASSAGPISPWKLVDNLSSINPSFRRGQQEDAHELLRCMLGELQLCTDIGFAEKIFGGHLRRRLQCSHCGHCSDSFELLLDLSLPIEGVDSLSTALKSFTQVEKMGDSKLCENCKEKVLSEIQVTIDRAPEVAVLHLKRFKINDDSVVVKINDHVEYPLELDLQPFLSNPSGKDNESSKYDLYAVLVHHGISTSSGHYFCFIRSSPDSWYIFVDSQVTEATQYIALNQEAYILFYKRQGCLWFSSMMEEERSTHELLLEEERMEEERSSHYLLSSMEEERSNHGLLSSMEAETSGRGLLSLIEEGGSSPDSLPTSSRSDFDNLGATLNNLGNTCFLNAVLQCLTHTVQFVESIRSYDDNDPNPCDGDFYLLSALREHVDCSLASPGNPISPWKLVNNLSYINDSFRGGQEEDAHELLRCMLGKLQQLCTLDDFVKKIFGGRLRSRLQCSHCGYCSDSFELLFDLSLPIEGADSLSTALKSFTRVEKMGDSKLCENCKEKVFSEIRVSIDRAPEVAVLHLKRFKTNDDSVVLKINDHVEYPLKLDLQPFLSNPSGYDNESSKYDLYAVLVHDGISTSAGHYFCFIRSSPDSWYRLDDSEVEKADESDALYQRAYILFYKRQGCPWFSSLMEAERPSPGSSRMEAEISSPVPDQFLISSNGEFDEPTDALSRQSTEPPNPDVHVQWNRDKYDIESQMPIGVGKRERNLITMMSRRMEKAKQQKNRQSMSSFFSLISTAPQLSIRRHLHFVVLFSIRFFKLLNSWLHIFRIF